VLSRQIVNDVFDSRLVNRASNTLSATTGAFTTLSTIYESTLAYLERVVSGGKIDVTKLPSNELFKLWEQESDRLWKAFSTEIDVVTDALIDTTEEGDKRRCEIRAQFLIGKPVVQLVLITAIARATVSGVPFEAAFKRANKLDWSKDNQLWQRVLLNGEKIIGGKQPVNFASRFIARMLGENLDDKETAHLLEQYKSLFDPSVALTKNLPDKVVD
jgi:hypothetical protein